MPTSNQPTTPSPVAQWVRQALEETPIYDLHTHLYPPDFGAFMLWGIDALVTYHYLIAEAFVADPMPYGAFWEMPQTAQADWIWKTLFVERPPLSEACRGVLTVLSKFGLDPNCSDLSDYRRFFAAQNPRTHVDAVFRLAKVHTAVMTNDVLDPAERALWLKNPPRDHRFKAVLRIDPLLMGWPQVGQSLAACGYGTSMAEVRRFLQDWIKRLDALYVAVSLSWDWRYPDDSQTTRVLQEAVLPVTREMNLPLAVMIGVARQVNPDLRLAGDAVGKSDIASLQRLCVQNPRNHFLVTMLSRENQHELAVAARKNPNLLLFGCWWFLNNPSLIGEITRMRMELLGTSFVPQHSDARILEQVIYKWEHTRSILATVLTEKFAGVENAGLRVTQAQVQQAVRDLLSDNFSRFLRRAKEARQ